MPPRGFLFYCEPRNNIVVALPCSTCRFFHGPLVVLGVSDQPVVLLPNEPLRMLRVVDQLWVLYFSRQPRVLCLSGQPKLGEFTSGYGIAPTNS